MRVRSLLLHIVAGALKACAFAFRLLPVKRRVVFMSRQGDSPSLDFRLLSKELADRFPGMEVAMCLTAPETKGVAQFAKSTLRQLALAQTSCVVVVDGYLPAVSVPSKRKGVTVIQLWHALGAIKRFGYQCLDTADGRSSDSARILRMHRNYDYVIAGGPWAVRHLALAFDAPASSVLPLGLPRLDYLSSDEFAEERAGIRQAVLAEYPRLAQGAPNILFAPTFRRNDPGFSGKQLGNACQVADRVDANLIFSGHPLDDSGCSDSTPCNVVSAAGFSTIDLLMVADALVTDYSAVAYEAAALGVPVFFYVPDIEEYRESPGLNADPMALYPDVASVDLLTVLQAACSGARSGNAFASQLGGIPAACTQALADLVAKSLD